MKCISNSDAQNSFSGVLKAELTGQKTLGFRLSVHETAEVSQVTLECKETAGKSESHVPVPAAQCHSCGGGELSRIDNTLHFNSSWCLRISKGHNIHLAPSLQVFSQHHY